MLEETLTVSQLGRRVQGALEDRFPEEVWVQGELHGLRRGAGGHVWFELVEPGPLGAPPLARIPVVLFDQHRRAVNALLKRSGGVRMTDGMAIRVRAGVDYYPPHGRLQLRMTGMDPAFTLGTLAADRDRVLQALATEGLLARNGRLATPLVPLRVGLVTAAGSAAYADVVAELDRSGFAFRVVHADARMQGRQAETSIVRALLAVARLEVDVVALVRGGGARTELACFDSEAVARTIAGLDRPVHTGIGHETDRSVADEVAHTAHKTPTACAAALVGQVQAYLSALDDRGRTVAAATTRALDGATAGLRHRSETATRAGRRALDHAGWLLDERRAGIPTRAQRALRDHRAALDRAAAAATGRARRGLDRAESDLATAEERARALDPERLLARGWSITRTVDGQVARAADLAPGTELLTTLADGEAHSTVTARTARPTGDDTP